MSRVVKALRRLMSAASVRERAGRRWHDGWSPFCLLLALVLACEGWSLFSPSLPLRAAGRQPYLILDFAAGAPIGQTFRMKGDGLASVRLQFFTDRSQKLMVLCTLLGVEPPWVGCPDTNGSRQSICRLAGAGRRFIFRP